MRYQAQEIVEGVSDAKRPRMGVRMNPPETIVYGPWNYPIHQDPYTPRTSKDLHRANHVLQMVQVLIEQHSAAFRFAVSVLH